MAEIADRPKPSDDDIRASYGFVAMLGDTVPEIRDLLNRAVSEQWTPDRFVMSVANTNWWKGTSSWSRDFVVRSITDPATAHNELERGARLLRSELAELGFDADLGIKWHDLRTMWLEAIGGGLHENKEARRGWLYERYTSGLGRHYNYGGGAPGGDAGRLTQQAFELARAYGYNSGDLSREVVAFVNNQMLTGGDIESWRNKMITYASAYYAPYAEDIKGGKTLEEVARPVVDRVAQLLETNPAALNFNDPILKKALTEWNADKGVNRAYTLREIEDMTRKDSRWLKTDNAMESAVGLVEEIGQKFGMLGGN